MQVTSLKNSSFPTFFTQDAGTEKALRNAVSIPKLFPMRFESKGFTVTSCRLHMAGPRFGLHGCQARFTYLIEREQIAVPASFGFPAPGRQATPRTLSGDEEPQLHRWLSSCPARVLKQQNPHTVLEIRHPCGRSTRCRTPSL